MAVAVALLVITASGRQSLTVRLSASKGSGIAKIEDARFDVRLTQTSGRWRPGRTAASGCPRLVIEQVQNYFLVTEGDVTREPLGFMTQSVTVHR